jgi:hypothetical protein
MIAGDMVTMPWLVEADVEGEAAAGESVEGITMPLVVEGDVVAPGTAEPSEGLEGLNHSTGGDCWGNVVAKLLGNMTQIEEPRRRHSLVCRFVVVEATLDHQDLHHRVEVSRSWVQ